MIPCGGNDKLRVWLHTEVREALAVRMRGHY
jgi:hypothetical protein